MLNKLINWIADFNPFENYLPETIYTIILFKNIYWVMTLPVKYNEYYNQFLDIQEKINEKMAGG